RAGRGRSPFVASWRLRRALTWTRQDGGGSAARWGELTANAKGPRSAAAAGTPGLSCRVHRPARRHQVREPEPAPLHHRTSPDRHRPVEDRTVVHERVELAALAARVARGGQVGEERGVVRTAAERRVELPGVHAHDDGAEPRVDERASERLRVTAPQRELAREPEPGRQVLAVL